MQKEKIYLNEGLIKNKKIVIGVSTGIDSMCLFSMLKKDGYDLVIAHVNHKRRKESDLEYEFLEKYAKECGVPFEGYVLNEEINSNFQEVARYKRYEFFKKVADKYDTNKIVVAHHLDDEAETILMRLSRGSSYRGYGGMKLITYDENYEIIRPLLYTSREKIEEYAKENNIKYFNDYTNDENHYTRNVVRHNVIPELKKINPNFLEAIKNYSIDMQNMFDHIKKEVDEFYNNSSSFLNESLLINKEDFLKLDEALKYWVVVKAINTVSSNTIIATHERVNSIIKLSESSGKEIEIKENISAYFESNYLVFERKQSTEKINLTINKMGEYEISGYKVVISQNYHALPHKNSYMLCYNELNSIFPIIIRNREDGDKIVVNGMTKSVSDVLKDNKIPKRLRDSVLVVLNKDGIFFVPNVIRKEADKSLENILYITFIKEN